VNYRQLGRTDLKVSEICFGCWAIGGVWWGTTDDSEAISAIRRAGDLGINFLDTADIYGFGHSEELVGRAIEGNRDRWVVATKCGVRWENGQIVGTDLSRAHMLEAVDASLKRLKTDYIDLYQAHWPDANTPAEDVMETMLEIRRQGKIRHIGVSNFSVQDMSACLSKGPLESDQPPYNLLQRQIEQSVAPFCLQEGVSLIVYSPLASGLLTGKFTRDWKFEEGDFRAGTGQFKGDNYLRNLAIVERLKALAGRSGRTVAQLAVAWTLMNPAVTSAIVGAKRPLQIEETAVAAG
jgi:methylglyoxal reductase